MARRRAPDPTRLPPGLPRPPGLRPPSSSRTDGTASAPAPPQAAEMASFRRRVLAMVRAIPAGRVATYGQISALAGHPRRARFVGQVLGSLRPGEDVPWQRVLNAQGRVSARGPGHTAPAAAEQRQARLLRAEGVPLQDGRVNLRRYRWRPEEDGFTGGVPENRED